MPAEAMMTVSGLVIGALAWNQLAAVSQDIEQPIATDCALQFRLGLHKAMQLASAQSRHLKTCFQDKTQYFLGMADLRVISPVSLVIRLPGNAQKLASPANTQALDLPLGEDLPDRFFTMETP